MLFILVWFSQERLKYKFISGCNAVYIGKTKRRLHDRETEHFKALTKSDHLSAIGP